MPAYISRFVGPLFSLGYIVFLGISFIMTHYASHYMVYLRHDLHTPNHPTNMLFSPHVAGAYDSWCFPLTRAAECPSIFFIVVTHTTSIPKCKEWSISFFPHTHPNPPKLLSCSFLPPLYSPILASTPRGSVQSVQSTPAGSKPNLPTTPFVHHYPSHSTHPLPLLYVPSTP